MSSTFKDQIERAAKLAKSFKASEAIQLLKQIPISSLDDNTRALYNLAISGAYIHLGSYEHSCFDEAVEFYRYSSEHKQYAQAKYLKGYQEQSLGQHEEANLSLNEAYTSFLRVKDARGAARSLNRQSLVLMQIGEINRAIANIEESIRLYALDSDQSNQQISRINVAIVLLSSGQFSKALTVFKESSSSEVVRAPRNAFVLEMCYALALALSDNISVARKHIQKASELIEENNRDRAQYYEYLGWINLLDGNFAATDRALTSGLKISLKIAPKSALISNIKRLQADLCIATDKFDLAEQTAREALVVAEAINERVEIAACYRVFAQVCIHRNETELARNWFDKAIDLFALVQSRYELAVTRYTSSMAGIYSPKECKTMLYLARDYFESEKITNWVEKVDWAIQVAMQTDAANEGLRIIGCAPAFRKVLEIVDNVAELNMSILLTGSTGTGKDLLARHIHNRSGFSGEFVSVNMAAIPDEMVEAELFGHTKGAFTGAERERIGLIAQADKGTLYLNEIGDATPQVQAKLLEVIETRQVRRLGENKSTAVEFRLITATNIDLKKQINEGLFRLDLFHRINEIPISLPELVDRSEDITLLVTHFVSMAVGRDVQTEAILPFCRFMERQKWPGNIRQLRGEVNRYCLAAGGDLNQLLAVALSDNGRSEQEQLKEALASTGWNRSMTARMLGVSEGTVRNRIRDYALDR